MWYYMYVYVCSGSRKKNPFCDCNYEHSENVCILLFYYLFFCAQADILLKKRENEKKGFICMYVGCLVACSPNKHTYIFYMLMYPEGGFEILFLMCIWVMCKISDK